jgi:hypothetical protein
MVDLNHDQQIETNVAFIMNLLSLANYFCTPIS